MLMHAEGCRSCVRFGEDVMETMVEWTADLLHQQRGNNDSMCGAKNAAILDVGTGNGVLPLELAQLGFANVTGAHMVVCVLVQARQCRYSGCCIPACKDAKGLPGMPTFVTEY